MRIRVRVRARVRVRVRSLCVYTSPLAAHSARRLFRLRTLRYQPKKSASMGKPMLTRRSTAAMLSGILTLAKAHLASRRHSEYSHSE